MLDSAAPCLAYLQLCGQFCTDETEDCLCRSCASLLHSVPLYIADIAMDCSQDAGADAAPFALPFVPPVALAFVLPVALPFALYSL